MNNRKKLHLVSLGCTKNLVDSEVMLGKLQEYQLTNESSEADVIIINSCGFIDEAKSESIETALELYNSKKESATLVMSGCLSERYKEEITKDLPEIDLFVGVGDYAKIDEILEKKENSFSNKVYLIDNEKRVITGSNYHTYIKISEGCNQTCSFCAIPSFKGKLHSRTLSSIIKEVKRLVEDGFYDFSFISQDSSSYGKDMGLKDGLIDLIEEVEKVKGVKSARILYLYPSTTSFNLIDKISNSKIFQTYFDIPIQHIENSMLKTMKRGFGEDKTKELLKYMKDKPNSFIRTTIIVGHPTETNESFEKLYNFMKEFNFNRFNVFTYSNEEDTTAFNMKQIEEETIKERKEILEELTNSQFEENLKELIGKEILLVVEGESNEHEYLLSARPLNWAKDIDGEILINDTSDLKIEYGKIYKASIKEYVGGYLLATLIDLE